MNTSNNMIWHWMIIILTTNLIKLTWVCHLMKMSFHLMKWYEEFRMDKFWICTHIMHCYSYLKHRHCVTDLSAMHSIIRWNTFLSYFGFDAHCNTDSNLKFLCLQLTSFNIFMTMTHIELSCSCYFKRIATYYDCDLSFTDLGTSLIAWSNSRANYYYECLRKRIIIKVTW